MEFQALKEFEQMQLPSNLTFKFRMLKRRLKHAWQRAVRGFDDSETWSLNTTFAQWFAPRLRRFKEVTIAYPAYCNDMEEWQEILQKMLDGFEMMADGDTYFTFDEQAHEKMQHSVDLFYQHFHSLWW